MCIRDRIYSVIFTSTAQLPVYLKSNMDRFIENIAEYQLMSVMYLKSNMDRFIAC